MAAAVAVLCETVKNPFSAIAFLIEFKFHNYTLAEYNFFPHGSQSNVNFTKLSMSKKNYSIHEP